MPPFWGWLASTLFLWILCVCVCAAECVEAPDLLDVEFEVALVRFDVADFGMVRLRWRQESASSGSEGCC